MSVIIFASVVALWILWCIDTQEIDNLQHNVYEYHRYCIHAQGSLVVPHEGSPDGIAFGTVTFNRSTQQVQWNLKVDDLNSAPILVRNIENYSDDDDNNALYVSGIQIRGPLGPGHARVAETHLSFGNVSSEPNRLDGSIDTTLELIDEFLENPDCFYLSIETLNIPDGAVRGNFYSC